MTTDCCIDRDLGVGFGLAAAAYAQTRPSYPAELVQWLFAIFRNRYTYDVAIMRGIRAALRRFAPHLVHNCVPLGSARAQLVEGHAAEIAARPDLFVDLDRRTFSTCAR